MEVNGTGRYNPTRVLKYTAEFLKSKDKALIALGLSAKLNGVIKEITEAVGVMDELSGVMANIGPDRWTVIDCCAGNGLLGMSIAMYFDKLVKRVISVDVRKVSVPTPESIELINKKGYDYSYMNASVSDMYRFVNDEPTAIVSVHPCGKSALDVIDLFNRTNASLLVMIPCCIDHRTLKSMRYVSRRHPYRYEEWCYILADMISTGVVDVIRDKGILTPVNTVITATKGYLAAGMKAVNGI